MTSTPASRRARATTFAPRSCPSRPGLAITTRMVPMPASCWAGRPGPHRTHATAALKLLDGGVAQDQVLDAVLAAEVDLRFGVVGGPLHGNDRAEPVGVVGHLVPRQQRGHPPIARCAHPGPLRQPLR